MILPDGYSDIPAGKIAAVATHLEMTVRPAPRPDPAGAWTLRRVDAPALDWYRDLYGRVGRPWLWFERRLVDDAALAALIAKPTIEIFVLYVRGVPAGFFELDTAAPRETKLCYFGLIPEFIGRRLGPYLLQAAIDQGVPPYEAREVHGWDECSQDDCPMLPAPWRTVESRGDL